jgi:glucokinase
MIEERLGLPCYTENDANAAAFGELLAGGAKGYRNVLMVTLGTGVGGGILLDGKIYTGAFFAGAEIGHMPMVFDGRPCNCGRKGCIETYCSANGLIRTTQEAMEDDKSSIMWQICGHDVNSVNGQTAFLAMEQGDATAQKVVDLYIRQLADALSGYINFIEPEILLLGGGVSKQGEALLAPLRRLISGLVYDRYAPKQTIIETATLENDAGIIGAAFLAEAAYI